MSLFGNTFEREATLPKDFVLTPHVLQVDAPAPVARGRHANLRQDFSGSDDPLVDATRASQR
jgi:hypothetical protein